MSAITPARTSSEGNQAAMFKNQGEMINKAAITHLPTDLVGCSFHDKVLNTSESIKKLYTVCFMINSNQWSRDRTTSTSEPYDLYAVYLAKVQTVGIKDSQDRLHCSEVILSNKTLQLPQKIFTKW